MRQALWAMLVFFGLLNLLWFVSIAPPPETRGYESCLLPDARSTPLCQSLRPSWMTWDHPDLASWAAVRGCTVAGDPFALTRLGKVVPERGLNFVGNLEFLQMVRAQEGVCEVPPGEARVVELELGKLAALEGAIWASRVERALESEASWISARSTWHAVGTRYLPLWLPALLLAWITLLTATRRMVRYTSPIELEVGPTGVRMDGRVYPRSTIAYLSIEGQRLRIERWLGPPVYSRPLPPEALANADEICGNVTLWEEDAEPDDRRRHRAALERLVRAT
ncbi:MAG: hypothetical protein KC656_15470 [Myxococcales bacterium]|nr:hypothetical protein [Myxococcales bacterium]